MAHAPASVITHPSSHVPRSDIRRRSSSILLRNRVAPGLQCLALEQAPRQRYRHSMTDPLSMFLSTPLFIVSVKGAFRPPRPADMTNPLPVRRSNNLHPLLRPQGAAPTTSSTVPTTTNPETAAITRLPELPTLTAPDCEIVAGPPLTFALGPSTFQRGATLTGSFSYTQTCVLESTTAATCSYSSSIAADCPTGPLSQSGTITFTGDRMQWGVLTLGEPPLTSIFTSGSRTVTSTWFSAGTAEPPLSTPTPTSTGAGGEEGISITTTSQGPNGPGVAAPASILYGIMIVFAAVMLAL
ncbi:hypothetical protein PG997_002192 [Apiospora hydei]|uniref:Uncharacterized protein n=1 Tax=Apiospora hydei TaxID=1337664 RepID=A0ABR1X8P1_9PEZI